MSRRFKPKVRLRAGAYRIVETDSEYGHVECIDGRDAMGVQRWRDLTQEEKSSPAEFDHFVSCIGQALAKRKRARMIR